MSYDKGTMNYIIQNINYFLNLFIFVGFIVSFKKISHDLLIKTVLISLIVSLISTTFLFQSLVLKNLLMVIIFGFSSHQLLKTSYKEFIIKYIIFLCMNFVCEMVCAPLFSKYFQNGIYEANWWAHILLTISLNILLFAVLKGHLCFLKNIMFLKNNYFISFILLISLITLSSLLGVLFSINIFQYYQDISNYVTPAILSFLYIIWGILLVLIIYLFIRQYHDEKNKIAMNELPLYYQQLMEEISLKDQEDYSRLKHDIMNYIQTYNTLKQNDKGD